MPAVPVGRVQGHVRCHRAERGRPGQLHAGCAPGSDAGCQLLAGRMPSGMVRAGYKRFGLNHGELNGKTGIIYREWAPAAKARAPPHVQL